MYRVSDYTENGCGILQNASQSQSQPNQAPLFFKSMM